MGAGDGGDHQAQGGLGLDLLDEVVGLELLQDGSGGQVEDLQDVVLDDQ